MEEFPDDMKRGIPAIHGKSMLEWFRVGAELRANGISIDDLTPNQEFHYLAGDFRYFLKVLEGKGRSKIHNMTCPIVVIERIDADGQVMDSSAGLLIGVTLDGIGNFPMRFLPQEGQEYTPFIIETLPSPDEPDGIKQMILGIQN